ncbi:hypothetical protein FQA39_LY14547 [Lamprigera yunnana]|nr:hypothetical protein FQA39_LY14547 [Lamprigera yunnana]
MLFVVSTLLSLGTCLVDQFLSPAFQWVNGASDYEINLINLKTEYKQNQAKLHLVDNFAKYSKIQRKVNGIDQELHELQNQRLRNGFFIKTVLLYSAKIAMTLLLLIFSIYYRYTPVLVLSSNFSLFPFDCIVSFPLHEQNCVSVPFWILCCTTVGTIIKKLKYN